jgi:hypothetical protein
MEFNYKYMILTASSLQVYGLLSTGILFQTLIYKQLPIIAVIGLD